jgi:hypothetical protein
LSATGTSKTNRSVRRIHVAPVMRTGSTVA